MAKYRKMLVAIDLSEETEQILETAVSLRQDHGAELLVVHVVERVGTAYGGDVVMDMAKYQDQLNTAAKERLAAYADQYNVEASQVIVTVGHPQIEIDSLAKEHDIDLVVIGSHGRRGFQRLMLGSTANSILHGATYDVLAVRVKEGL